jgi:hypothetical protein
MSDLTNLEKRKLEKLLGMASGYVLNFSNKTFAEFVMDCTGLNIFDPRYEYSSGSKANRLRAFWIEEDNKTVGKLMSEMLDDSYEFFGPVSPLGLKEECRQIVARLTGKPLETTTSRPDTQKEEDAVARQRSNALRQLKEEFFRLAAESDRNKAGLALEPLLNKVFKLFDLSPREPFRVVGEQIDGSFVMDGQVYLLESKWEKHPLPEADLLIFRGKIEGKSTFTRGVMIALNDVSAPAREAITRGKAPSFFVMNGHDLMMVLSEAISLTEFLRKRVRLLAEKGYVCVPFSEVA